ncbi:MAG: hypothetical protein ACREAA_08875 [Candidatus Polarisedimenticolia bacterium]
MAFRIPSAFRSPAFRAPVLILVLGGVTGMASAQAPDTETVSRMQREIEDLRA